MLVPPGSYRHKKSFRDRNWNSFYRQYNYEIYINIYPILNNDLILNILSQL